MFFGFAHRFLAICCALVILLLCHLPLQAQDQAVELPQQPEEARVAEPEQLNLIEIYRWTNSLLRDLIDLQTDLHLRSIDQAAADKLHRTRAQSDSAVINTTEVSKKEENDAYNNSDR